MKNLYVIIANYSIQMKLSNFYDFFVASEQN